EPVRRPWQPGDRRAPRAEGGECGAGGRRRARVARDARHEPGRPGGATIMIDTESTANDEAALDALLAYIKEQRGFDFSGYKQTSLGRRIEKRLQARHAESYGAYRALLEADPDEFVELFNTILINVTSFFRDEFAWTFLSEQIVPRILETRDGEPLRIWSAGCATGEEAFSLAMIFGDAMGEEEFKSRVKIYATDVDEEALAMGRHST